MNRAFEKAREFMYRNARPLDLARFQYHFENGNVLCLELEDNIVAQGKKDLLTTYLTDIFEERFRRPIEIKVSYMPVKDSKLRFNNSKIRQEVDAILERVEQASEKQREETPVEEKASVEESGNKAKESKEKKSFGDKKQETTRFGGGSKGFGGKGSGFKGRKSSFGGRGRFAYGVKDSDDKNLIYGRNFDDEPMEMKHLITEMGEITVRGKVIKFETREIRDERTILSFAVTDFTDTIMVKMFIRNEQLPDILGEIKPGAFLKVKGVATIDKFDRELSINSVTGVRKIPDFTESRLDTAPEKRVELHCHTKMSDMDAVTNVQDLVKRAHDWGHKALAITDHGVVQGFTEAHHYMQGLPADDPFKVIYGVEGYLVDDLVDVAVN